MPREVATNNTPKELKMKKIEIYKDDELQLSIIVSDYQINTYINSFEITCKVNEIETNYNIPLNKGYKVIVEI